MLSKPLALGLLALSALSAAAPTNYDGQLTFGNPTFVPEVDVLQIPSLALTGLSALAIPREHLAELQAHIAGLPERRRVQLGEDPSSIIDITEGEKVSSGSVGSWWLGGSGAGMGACARPTGSHARMAQLGPGPGGGGTEAEPN